ncbi:MAG: phosphopentomutase [Actinobacteria bacterium]|nr:phosphopentomutase [Actinomycetota bacterium]
MTIRRTIIVVLDSVGVGALPDARDYGDEDSNTLANTARAVGGLSLPNFGRLGLGNIIPIEGVPPESKPSGSFGKMAEVSPGKDTTTGHWELMGIHLDKAFPTYPHGFPSEIIDLFERRIGRKVLGNKPASGTEIIEELGKEHLTTGRPIVYTSADSVFQIAAHEEVIPINQLYHFCKTARQILTGDHGVGRVIARPFVGTPGDFVRTARRKDFSLPPAGKTLLDFAQEAGVKVFAVGKIGEIFTMRGIDESVKTANNMEGVDRVVELMDANSSGIIFVNLVDFDMLWGHRNDAPGYAEGLKAVDSRLPELLDRLRSGDVLFVTADHGCDPTTPSTDHSREYVPLLVTGLEIEKGVDLEIRHSFSDLGKTIADLMAFRADIQGKSFANLVFS